MVSEFRPLIKGRRILEIRDVAPDPTPWLTAPAPEKFIILLEDAESTMQRIVRLVVSVAADLNYLLISPRPQRRLKKGEGSWFAQGLHSRCADGRVRAVEVAEKDRIATFVIDDRDGRGHSLKIELFGRHANIVLVDEEGIVVRALRETRTEARHIAEGFPYPPPRRPAAKRKTFLQETRFLLENTSALSGLALNEAADRYYHEHEMRSHLERTGRTFLSKIRRESKRLRKTIAQTEEKIADAKAAEKIKEQGDLIKAHFHLVKRGMDSIEVANIFSSDGETLSIALDPSLEPAQNLEAIYKRYRKMTRSVPHLDKMLARYGDRLDALGRLEEGIEQAASLEELEPFGEELIALSLLKPVADPLRTGPNRASSTETRGSVAKSEKFRNIRRFFISRSQEALVGKDGETNHRLLQLARGRDIWLHCQGAPGAHVVVSMARGANPSLDLLLRAGQLAVHFSQRRGAEQADVIYTERKYVRALKGGKKGRVTVERFKTLHIRSDPELLRSILGAR